MSGLNKDCLRFLCEKPACQSFAPAIVNCLIGPITLKQIQIIDALVAKFRKTHNATPEHETFKTPEQASPNFCNFGDT